MCRVRRRVGATLLCLTATWMLTVPPAGAGPGQTPPATTATAAPGGPPDLATAKATAAAGFGHLALRFEANQGQADAATRFVVRSGGTTAYLGTHEALLTAPRKPGKPDAGPDKAGAGPDKPDAAPDGVDVLDMALAGSNPDATVAGTDQLPGVSNYLIGNDPAAWHTGVPAYARVRYSGVYPGVDLVWHGEGGQLEYDFEVAPGADPAPIALALHGGDRPVVDNKGDLVTHAGTSELRQHAPVVYQEVNGARRSVEGHFVVRPDDTVGFAVGEYDRHQHLVIDPAIVYATYLGGSGTDAVAGIALDASNNAFVAGWTSSADFPVANALKDSCAKCNNGTRYGTNVTHFVTKLNPTGTAVAYSTYLGGTNGYEGGDVVYGGSIAVDSTGAAYVSGVTTSTDFPIVGGYKGTCGTPTAACGAMGGPDDAFVAKLAPAGSSLAYSSYIGGSGYDRSRGLALGAGGVVYVGGLTTSADFLTADPGSATPVQATFGGDGDDFVVKIDTAAAGASSLVYSSYLGGSRRDNGTALAVDPAAPGVVYVAGSTQSTNFPTTASAYRTGLAGSLQSGTVAKIDTTAGASGLVYSSYVGGASAANASAFTGLAAKSGVAYLTGNTDDPTYPTTGTAVAYQAAIGGGSDAVVSEVNTTLSGASSLAYSTFLGGTSTDIGQAIAVDAANLITVVGSSGGSGFPLSGQLQNFDNSAQVFVTRLDPTKGPTGLVYSTALTGYDAFAVALDGASPANAYVGGKTMAGFPAGPGAYQASFGGSPGAGEGDGFVAKLSAGTQPAVTGLSVAHGPFTGGTSVVISGLRFTGATAVKFANAAATSFSVNSDTQITATAPCATGASPCPDTALSTAAAAAAAVTVTAGGATSVPNTSAMFTYGEGDPSPAATCSACLGSERLSVALQNGKVLSTQTGSEEYVDGTATNGSTTFASATRTFAASDVGKRLSAAQSVGGTTTYLFPPGTTIASVANAHTVTLSSASAATASAADFFMSNNVTQLYDPATDAWSPTGACNKCGAADFADGGATITLLASGKVLVAGGLDPTGPDLSSGQATSVADAFVYDPAAGTWAPTGSLSVARKGATATLLGNAKVVVAGGSGTNSPTWGNTDAKASAELYDPATGAFAATGSMGTARANAQAVALAGGNVLVTGGFGNATGMATASAEQYNPGTGSWSPAGTMVYADVYHTLTALPASGACGANCGKVLVAGGECGYPGTGGSCTDPGLSAELYSPATNSWATTGARSVRRVGGAAVVLPSGKVLLTGGNTTPDLAERFDPATATWASAGPNIVAGSCCAVVLAPGPTSVCATRCGQALGVNGAGPSSVYVPRPTVTALTPSSGGAGTTVTLTGTGLTAVSAVSFGGVAGTSVTHSATSPDTSLTVVVPSGLSGAVGVLATSPGGVSSTAGPQFALSTNIPTAVQSLVAQAMNTAAVLTWSPPASNGGSTITGYTVVTNAPPDGAGHAAVSVSPCSPTCSSTISGLSNSLALPGKGGYTFSVYAVTTNGNGFAATSAPVFPQATAGTFVAVTPSRLLDTRSGSGNWGTCTPSPCATVGAGGTISVQVAGQGPQGGGAAPVPASGASAVVLNVTVTNPTAASVLTVFPSDAAQPQVSNLNYTAGQTVPNLVTVKLGADGRVKITNAFGSTDVVADVVGWYSDGTTVAGSRFNALAPARILDTRSGTNVGTCVPSPCATLGNAGVPETIDVAVAGAGGVPASGAAAVVLNATVTNPSTPSVLTVFPSDVAQPTASNLNYTAAQTVPNLVTVKLGGDGKVKLNNAFGSVDVIFDVVGWYAQAGSVAGTRFTPLTPARILDTRPAPDNTGNCDAGTFVHMPCAKLGVDPTPETTAVTVAGQAPQGGGVAPVPGRAASAVVMNVTVTAPDTPSVLTVWPSDVAQPTASNLNYTAGQTVPNLVAVKLGVDGRVKLNNAFGSVHVIFDVNGWFNDGKS